MKRRRKLKSRYGCFRLPVIKEAKKVKATARKDANWLARTDPKAKEVEFSIPNFDRLTPEGKRFIVLHERAHLKAGTDHNSDFYDELVKLCDANGIDWRTAFQLESFNCFSGDTRFWANGSLVNMKDSVGQEVQVVAGDGLWRMASVKEFGENKLFRYVFGTDRSNSKFELAYSATKDHRWVTANRGEVTNLRVGDKVAVNPRQYDQSDWEFMLGRVHGLIFGDGARSDGGRHYNYFQIRLCGPKNTCHLDWISTTKYYRSHSYPASFNGDPHVFLISDTDLKEVPDDSHSFRYQAGFLRGWLDADATVRKNVKSHLLDSIRHEALEWVIERAPFLGVCVTGKFVTNNERTNYGPRSRKLMRVSFAEKPINYVVRRVEELAVEKTYCVVEPVTGLFTLDGGLITGNCHSAH